MNPKNDEPRRMHNGRRDENVSSEPRPITLMDAMFPTIRRDLGDLAGRRFPPLFLDSSFPLQGQDSPSIPFEAVERRPSSGILSRRHLMDVLEAACRLCDDFADSEAEDNQNESGDFDDEMSN